MILSVSLLLGCFPDPAIEALQLVAPSEGYPPLAPVLKVIGAASGVQYVWEIEGKTYNQPENELSVVIEKLPCVVTVTIIGNGDPKTLTKTIALRNSGPIIGQPKFYGKTVTAIIPRQKYIVTFPDAYDAEGGPVTMIDASVYTAGWIRGDEWKKWKQYNYGDVVMIDGESCESIISNRDDKPPSDNWRLLPHLERGRQNTIFCPPLESARPPTPDVYHAQVDSLGDPIDNAFVFFSMWESPLDVDAQVPWCPKSRWMTGYAGCWTSCCPEYWPTWIVPADETIMTVTFVDEMGATTTESFVYPTSPYIPCGFSNNYE